MKINLKEIVKPLVAVAFIAVMLSSCSATVKVPNHPGPGEPPPPPKVEVHQN